MSCISHEEIRGNAVVCECVHEDKLITLPRAIFPKILGPEPRISVIQRPGKVDRVGNWLVWAEP